MNRFNRPRLIGFDDPAYQQHIAQIMLQRANQRGTRPPTQRDLFGGESESLLRSALSTRFELSDRRMLEYEERKGHSWQRKYREVDAVVVEGQTRVHVFEIKASRRTGSLHRALRQLRDTREILQLAFRSVSVTVLLVDTGLLTADEQAEIVAAEDAPERVPQTLADALAEHPEVRRVESLAALQLFSDAVELVVLSVNDILALADGAPLSLDWDADDEEPAPAAPPSSAPLYSTADEEESPFAAALRKAAGSNKRKL